MTTPIALTLNGQALTLPPGTSPTLSLLDWLRATGRTGTKEGCAEGDCGACTVVLEQPDGTRVPVNGCLTLLGQVHGRAVRTVEGLARAGVPHPIQVAMAESDGTQCGFCTPGIVMAAWAHAREGGDVHEALAGNLCRCTGYRPIVEVFAGLSDDGDAPPPAQPAASARFEAPGQIFHLPATMEELLALRAAHPEAWLLAGGTDLNLRVSDHREAPPAVICLLNVPALHAIEARDDALVIGAAVSYRRLLDLCRAERGFAPLAGLLARLGSRQIRGLGSLGGNLGTASPIGDALPPLVALGARVHLASRGGAREMPVERFLTGYRANALAPDEVLTAITLPRGLASIARIFGPPGSETRKANDIFQMIRDMTPEKIKALPFLYVDCGTDDFLFQNNREFVELLISKRIPHEYRQLPGGHTWIYWDKQVQEFLRVSSRIFSS
ncbi:FAD binding domain-containing protein [Leptolyngbya sp. 15MV]|nr:FAD binding domain-containing protein [Leptolyngbya sp. 15MV]